MPTPPKETPIILRRRTVLFLVFFVLGALTIPLIWKSPAFGRREKIFWTVFASLYTAAMIAVIVVYAIVVYQATIGSMGGLEY